MTMVSELPEIRKFWPRISFGRVTKSQKNYSSEQSEELRRMHMRRELTELFQDKLRSDSLMVVRSEYGHCRKK